MVSPAVIHIHPSRQDSRDSAVSALQKEAEEGLWPLAIREEAGEEAIEQGRAAVDAGDVAGVGEFGRRGSGRRSCRSIKMGA